MNPDKIKAGRKLDALIAEKVMGLVPCTSPCHERTSKRYTPRPCHAKPDSPDEGGETRMYSTEYNAMEEVIEKMPRLQIIKYPGPLFYVGTGDLDDDDGWEFDAEANTLPLAVCRAALKAAEKGREG